MSSPDNFPIVGVGASAGGIEALQGLLKGMPLEPGLALVVVTHLSPDRESFLREVIGRYISLPVLVAANGMTVEKNKIYVTPPDVVLTIEGRELQTRINSSRRERKPIDIFLSSLAVDLKEMSAGIILSGGDGDGTLGLKAIKEHGGITFAQVGDGYGPRHPEMPNSAISSGLVDFAIPVEEMGTKLAEFVLGSPLDRRIAELEASDDNLTIDEGLPEITESFAARLDMISVATK